MQTQVASPPAMFAKRYADVFKGDEHWQAIKVDGRPDLRLGRRARPTSQNPPYFEGLSMEPTPVTDIVEARVLAMFGDSITTDHISPGRLDQDRPRPAGRLSDRPRRRSADFNCYGARRGNHEVMMRGTFANIRIRNKITPAIEGGVTKHFPSRRHDVDLRRGHALPGRGPSAGRVRRQGIRHRLVARLGGQGHQACWASAR